MTLLRSVDHVPRTGVADLQARLLDYAGHVDELRSPEDVLNELHAVTTRSLPLRVLGALRLPIKSGDWASIQLGKSIFLHQDVPDGWWEEHETVAPGKTSLVCLSVTLPLTEPLFCEKERLLKITSSKDNRVFFITVYFVLIKHYQLL